MITFSDGNIWPPLQLIAKSVDGEKYHVLVTSGCLSGFEQLWFRQSPLVICRIKSENRQVNLKTCTVSCEDEHGHQHVLEVTAESLYEAVAQALAVYGSNGWVGNIGKGQTISVRVQQPAIEHRVRVAEFEDWLGRNGKSPAEMSVKVRLRSILAPKTENQ